MPARRSPLPAQPVPRRDVRRAVALRQSRFYARYFLGLQCWRSTRLHGQPGSWTRPFELRAPAMPRQRRRFARSRSSIHTPGAVQGLVYDCTEPSLQVVKEIFGLLQHRHLVSGAKKGSLPFQAEVAGRRATRGCGQGFAGRCVSLPQTSSTSLPDGGQWHSHGRVSWRPGCGR